MSSTRITRLIPASCVAFTLLLGGTQASFVSVSAAGHRAWRNRAYRLGPRVHPWSLGPAGAYLLPALLTGDAALLRAASLPEPHRLQDVTGYRSRTTLCTVPAQGHAAPRSVSKTEGAARFQAMLRMNG